MTNKLLILTLLFITCDLYAQKIENVHAELQGKKINIYYDITGAITGQTFDVRIYCSTDGGSTWWNPLYYVTGDAGKGIIGGYNKKIVWDVLKDMEKLEGDKIQFEIRAKVIGGNTFTDARDGQTYKTVMIGAQVWMAENLNYKTNPSWCYNNKSSNCDTYGRLYKWEEAKNACPSGWHLPTDDEWKTLEGSLGMTVAEQNKTRYRGTNQGSKMANDVTGQRWSAGNLRNNANFGSSGFDLVPSGWRYSDGRCYNRGGYSDVWTSTGSGTDAWERELDYTLTQVNRNTSNKAYGFSVRCIKD